MTMQTAARATPDAGLVLTKALLNADAALGLSRERLGEIYAWARGACPPYGVNVAVSAGGSE